MHMVSISHQGVEPDDKVKIEADTQAKALTRLLEIRGVTNIAALEPAVIETKWC